VGEILLKKGGQTIQQIGMESKLEMEQIKNALLILRQHNLILLEERAIEKSERKIIEYTIHLSFLLARIRFPKYILLARERFGLEGEMIFEQLLLWGQLTIERTISSLVQKEERRAKDNLQKIFQKMINDSFVSDVSIIDSSRSKESNLNYNFVMDGNVTFFFISRELGSELLFYDKLEFVNCFLED
jgi:hypothetical protein